MQKHMRAYPHDQVPWRPTAEVGILAGPDMLTMVVVEARLRERPGAMPWGKRQQSVVKKQCLDMLKRTHRGATPLVAAGDDVRTCHLRGQQVVRRLRPRRGADPHNQSQNARAANDLTQNDHLHLGHADDPVRTMT
jgi:hypothetical protein